jgi:hypothetical protein
MTPHLTLLAILAISIPVSVVIAFTGKFTLLNSQGILSGPFSALLLLGALQLAVLILTLLDWRVWAPRRNEAARAIDRWLAVDVLGNATPPAEDWQSLQGTFRGCEITLARTYLLHIKALRWTVRVDAPFDLRLVRLPQPATDTKTKNATAPDAFSSGDAEFDQRYAWQTTQPERVLPLLKEDATRLALKRLASLFAQRGEIADVDPGLSLNDGQLTFVQAPATTLTPGTFSAQETLLILHDLSLLALRFSGKDVPAPVEPPPAAVTPDAAGGSEWMALGCLGAFLICVWLGATYLAARYMGLPAGMITFFVPPVGLAIGMMVLSAGSTPRDAEVERTIRSESAAVLQRFGDLAACAERFKVDRSLES